MRNLWLFAREFWPHAGFILTASGWLLGWGRRWSWLNGKLARLKPTTISLLEKIVTLAVLIFFGYFIWAAEHARAESLDRSPRLVADPMVELEAGTGTFIKFHARFVRAGERARIRLHYLYTNGAEAIDTTKDCPVSDKDGFISGDSLDVTVATILVQDEQTVLQWGNKASNCTKVGVPAGESYLGQIAVIGDDNHEEDYPFMIVGSAQLAHPIVFGPRLIAPAW